jgi:hypothetical protein
MNKFPAHRLIVLNKSLKLIVTHIALPRGPRLMAKRYGGVSVLLTVTWSILN